MKNLTVENIYTRQTAKQLTKKNFWRMLGMMLLTGLIFFVLFFGGIYLLSVATDTPWTITAQTSAYSIYVETAAAASPAFSIGYFVLMLVVSVPGTGLNLGLIRSITDISRGEEKVPVRRIFSRMKYFLKGWGLSLWVGFKMLLWALPVYAIAIVAAVAVTAAGITTTDSLTGVSSIPIDQEVVITLLTILPFAALILLLGLVIPAALRYSQSSYVLADEPATGVFESVRKSKAMMKGHKWQYFKLFIPYILKVYGWMLLFVVVFVIAGTFLQQANAWLIAVLGIAMVVLLYAMLFIYISRIMVAACVYYLKRKGEMPAVPPEEEERIVAWQPAEAKTAPESVASADDHIACWNPGGEVKEDKE